MDRPAALAKKTVQVNYSIVTLTTTGSDKLKLQFYFFDLLSTIQNSSEHLAYLSGLKDNADNYLFSGTSTPPVLEDFSPCFFPTKDKNICDIDRIHAKLSKILSELSKNHKLAPLDEQQQSNVFRNIRNFSQTDKEKNTNNGSCKNLADGKNYTVQAAKNVLPVTYQNKEHWFDKMFSMLSVCAVLITLIVTALNSVDVAHNGFPLITTILTITLTLYISFEALLKTTITNLDRFARLLRRAWMRYSSEHQHSLDENYRMIALTVAVSLAVSYLLSLNITSAFAKAPSAYTFFKDKASSTVIFIGSSISKFCAIILAGSKLVDTPQKKEFGFRALKAVYTVVVKEVISKKDNSVRLKGTCKHEHDEVTPVLDTAIATTTREITGVLPAFRRERGVCAKVTDAIASIGKRAVRSGM